MLTPYKKARPRQAPDLVPSLGIVQHITVGGLLMLDTVKQWL